MRIRVRHETRYLYSTPVRLGRHHLRFLPRDGEVDVVAARIDVDPVPAFYAETVDRHGNRVVTVDFDGVTDRFHVVGRFEVETAPPPALTPPLPPLPWGDDDADDLAAYRDAPDLDDTVRAFADDLATSSRGEPTVFLERLTETLFRRTDRYIRSGGYAQSPAETLALRSGACRDVTALFLAAARAEGLAARFVSGYQARSESADGRRHLHAWPEVFLPGVGWRGFDPTHGLPVTDGHVAVCAGPDQRATMPIEGSFFGSGVSSTLDYEVAIDVDD